MEGKKVGTINGNNLKQDQNSGKKYIYIKYSNCWVVLYQFKSITDLVSKHLYHPKILE